MSENHNRHQFHMTTYIIYRQWLCYINLTINYLPQQTLDSRTTITLPQCWSKIRKRMIVRTPLAPKMSYVSMPPTNQTERYVWFCLILPQMWQFGCGWAVMCWGSLALIGRLSRHLESGPVKCTGVIRTSQRRRTFIHVIRTNHTSHHITSQFIQFKQKWQWQWEGIIMSFLPWQVKWSPPQCTSSLDVPCH